MGRSFQPDRIASLVRSRNLCMDSWAFRSHQFHDIVQNVFQPSQTRKGMLFVKQSGKRSYGHIQLQRNRAKICGNAITCVAQFRKLTTACAGIDFILPSEVWINRSPRPTVTMNPIVAIARELSGYSTRLFQATTRCFFDTAQILA